MNVMPSHFYDIYTLHVNELAQKYQAQVVDLNDPKLFPKQCFADSVHLNGQ